MNKKICLGTGFLALALLAGCSSNSNTGTSPVAAGTITINGTASTAAQEVVTVADAEDSVVASTTTEADGAYTVNVNGTDVTFPLTVTVIHNGDTLRTIIPKPKDLATNEIEAKLDGFSKHAADLARQDSSFKSIDEAGWKAMLSESCKALSGDSTDTTTSCAPPLNHSRAMGDPREGGKHHQMMENDSLPVCPDSVVTIMKATMDSLKAELDSGVINDSVFHATLEASRPSCHPAFDGKHKRGMHHHKDMAVSSSSAVDASSAAE